MTNTPSCPEFSLLSQFLDGDLEKSQAHQLSQHVGSCQYCRAQIRDLEHAQEWERGELSAAQNPLSQSTSQTSCLSSETLFAYERGSLSPTDERTVDAHILACRACLSEVKEVMRAAATLTTVDLQPVPAELEARVESQWVIVPALPRLVIQLTREGLRLIDKYLTAPLLDVQEVLIPLPAY